jgi:hypothetical protein
VYLPKRVLSNDGTGRYWQVVESEEAEGVATGGGEVSPALPPQT